MIKFELNAKKWIGKGKNEIFGITKFVQSIKLIIQKPYKGI